MSQTKLHYQWGVELIQVSEGSSLVHDVAYCLTGFQRTRDWKRKSDTKILSVVELCTSTGIEKRALVLLRDDFLHGGPGLAVGHNDRGWMSKREAM